MERIHRGLAGTWGKRDEVGRGRLTGPYGTSLSSLYFIPRATGGCWKVFSTLNHTGCVGGVCGGVVCVIQKNI